MIFFVNGNVPKWLKGPLTKSGRGVKACESSNLSVSAMRLGNLIPLFLDLLLTAFSKGLPSKKIELK